MDDGHSSDRPERPPPIDALDRQRLKENLVETFFVEAGAGTGKTTALVGRIVALVARGCVTLDRLAAITFTEAAAADLRSKIRRDLERAASNSKRTEDERIYCKRAVAQVDLASIQTIHAFAVTLLRTFPIEAGLPPGFRVLDDVESNLAFDERFREWLWDDIPTEAPEARERRDAMRRALLLGMTFENLRQVADAFEEQWDLLDECTTWPAGPAPDPVEVAHRLGSEIQSLRDRFRYAKLGEEDALIAEYRRHELAVARLLTAREASEGLTALLSVSQFKLPGRKSDWRSDESGQNALETIKDALRAANTTIAETIDAHRRAALASILIHVRDFALESAKHRRSLGVATFHDLLTWTRNLLRGDLEVRRLARNRFSRIFVDEFQDTDPLQAEIVWFLASDDSTAKVAEWRDVRLEPGKLFIVGDPKQSIYRFRRADIGLYSRIYGEASEDTRAQLRENFRSVPFVIDWINYQFKSDMDEEVGIQAPYVALNVPRTADERGGVHVFGDVVDGNADLAREEEAATIARFALNVVASGWQVRKADGRWRSAKYRDICVLLRTRTNVRDLEDAFERLEVPYRMESGSLVLDTQEVREVLACLRAIDDPSDQVALVAALRSPAYACSDVDLLDWVEAGGKLDYLQPHDGMTGFVAEAFASLAAFHGARVDLSVAVTVEAFIRDRMLAVGVFDSRRPREAWRRLRYVVDRARSLSAAGRPTLRALVDWMDSRRRAQVRDVESALAESDEDAVRVMTIHGAKGLEFPIVVLTGLSATSGGQPSSVRVLTNRDTDAIDVKVGRFETTGFADAKAREERLEAAEQIRLLYVAATRARDHLVLSLFHGKKATKSAAARFRHGLLQEEAPRWSEISLDDIPDTIRTARVEPQAARPLAEQSEVAEEQWSANRAAAIDAARVSPVVVASALGEVRTTSNPNGHATIDMGSELSLVANAQGVPPAAARLAELLNDVDSHTQSDLDPDAPPSSPADDLAARIGRAVHTALAQIGRDDASPIDPAVRNAALENNVLAKTNDIRRLVAAALESPTVVASRTLRHWCEVSVGVPIGSTVLAGRVDLVFENADGTLQIVDFKTDDVAAATVVEHAGSYRAQAGAYALALQEITHKRVTAVTLVFAALGGYDVTWTDIADLVAEARILVGRRNELTE